MSGSSYASLNRQRKIFNPNGPVWSLWRAYHFYRSQGVEYGKARPAVQVAGSRCDPRSRASGTPKFWDGNGENGGLWEKQSLALAGLSCRDVTTPTCNKLRCARLWRGEVRKRTLRSEVALLVLLPLVDA